VYRSPDLVDVPSPSSPARLTLLPPYPNPFNPSTTIRLYVPGTASGQQKVEVGVYDLRGRLVSRLHAGPAPSGWHTWHWLGRDDQGRRQASGLYFVRARAGAQTIIQKALLVK
jgi:flagellar hook assembly protein FlgD